MNKTMARAFKAMWKSELGRQQWEEEKEKRSNQSQKAMEGNG